jgi:hypothetical protein
MAEARHIDRGDFISQFEEASGRKTSLSLQLHASWQFCCIISGLHSNLTFRSTSRPLRVYPLHRRRVPITASALVLRDRLINGSIDSPLQPQPEPEPSPHLIRLIRVRIQTWWRATIKATTTTKAKTLVRENIRPLEPAHTKRRCLELIAAGDKGKKFRRGNEPVTLLAIHLLLGRNH